MITLDEPITENYKPRKPLIAFLLSLIIPGLGQIYNGQIKKGMLLFFLLIAPLFVFAQIRLANSFYGLVLIFLLELALRIFTLVDAVRVAKRRKEFLPKKINTWQYNVLFAAAMLCILFLCDVKEILGIQTVKIPTASGQPTVQEGDWVVADFRAYEDVAPDYGDIIVFKQSDGYLYNYRIIGLPNDTIDINTNLVSVNNKACKATFIKETAIDRVPVLEFEEELPNKHKYHIYKWKDVTDTSYSTMKDIIVPMENYFVMGDNRNNAADSRYIGFVKKEDIKGRFIYSYWGKTLKRINVDFRNK